MNLIALYTGGKDSTMAIYKAKSEGHNISFLLTMLPKNIYSYMFHGVNIPWTKLQAEAMSIKHFLWHTEGVRDEEVEDLKKALSTYLTDEIDGVLTGAITSKYQKSRVDRVCRELGLRSFSPLWGVDHKRLLYDYIENEMAFMIVSVSVGGLTEEHLGWVINSRYDVDKMIALSEKYGFNASGEGGEYETYVLNAPIFKRRVVVDRISKKWYGDSGYIIIESAHLE